MNSDFYAILPLILVYEENYSILSSKAILLYALFLNRAKFSLQNKKFRDSDGVFIYYSASQISKHLRCNKVSARKVLNELEEAGLVKIKFQEFGLPLKIYVNDVRAGDKSTNSVASEKSQDKFSQKLYSNSNYNAKPYKSTSVSQEKQVSFDANIMLTQMQKNRRNFGEIKSGKKKKKTEYDSQSS